MKNVFFIIALLFGVFISKITFGQIRTDVRININSQPLWGPEGYDRVDYYYLPDIDVFYNVPNRQYIYLENRRWVFARNLPLRYHDFDLYRGYKVVVNEYKPYRNAVSYRTKYVSFRGNHDQRLIRNSKDSRYFENKEHPEHNKWLNERNERNKMNNSGKKNNSNKNNNGNKGKGNKGHH